ncbi:hypothetical protein JW887_00895 [Candidatus Dojkabacteria bacterium]|nr:hypothetical protein [Candidatus Dojkabacteria bacterium]
MSYFVIAYPDLKKADYDFLQSYRKKYDEKFYNIIKPHFTLVSRIGDVSESNLVNECKSKLQAVSMFDFEICCATILPSPSKGLYYEILIPSKGLKKLVDMHLKLYSGELMQFYSENSTSLPHIGIGCSGSANSSIQNVSRINKKNRKISGRIQKVDVIELDNNTIREIITIALQD